MSHRPQPLAGAARNLLRRRFFAFPIAVCIALALASCVRSKVIVTTEPADAEIYMNGIHLGETPLEHPYTWFWYYDFIAEKEGYQTKGVRRIFKSPVWLWPPLDLVMEAMPFYLHDTRKVHIVMEPVDERPAPAFVDDKTAI